MQMKLFVVVGLLVSLFGCGDSSPGPATAEMAPRESPSAKSKNLKEVTGTVLRVYHEKEFLPPAATEKDWHSETRFYLHLRDDHDEKWDINGPITLGKIKFVEPGDKITFWLDEGGRHIKVVDLQWAKGYEFKAPPQAWQSEKSNKPRLAEKPE